MKNFILNLLALHYSPFAGVVLGMEFWSVEFYITMEIEWEQEQIVEDVSVISNKGLGVAEIDNLCK